jgi:protein OS-9
MTIGGVVVGSKKHIGDEHASKLTLPRGVMRQAAPLVEVLASRKAGADEVELMSDAELEKLNLNPKLVKEGVEEMKSVAGDKAWTLQYVKDGDKVDYYGVFDDEEGEIESQGGVPKKGLPKGQAGGQKPEGQRGKQEGEGQKAGGKEAAQQADEEQEGSQEEFFKEEL